MKRFLVLMAASVVALAGCKKKEDKKEDPADKIRHGEQDGKGTGGGIGGSMDGQSSFVTVYVKVDDPQAYLDKAVSLGGKVLMPVMEIPGAATIAQFQDPSGNLVGLVKAGSMDNSH